MNARLGTPSQDLRTERLNALQRVEAQINEQRRMESSSRSSLQPQPRSANLEQLYHEAIPMNKALSHSGPSAFGNGLLQHPVSQFTRLWPQAYQGLLVLFEIGCLLCWWNRSTQAHCKSDCRLPCARFWVRWIVVDRSSLHFWMDFVMIVICSRLYSADFQSVYWLQINYVSTDCILATFWVIWALFWLNFIGHCATFRPIICLNLTTILAVFS